MNQEKKNELMKEADNLVNNCDVYSPYSVDKTLTQLYQIIEELVED